MPGPECTCDTPTHSHDAYGSLVSLIDSSPGAKADAYAMAYNSLNQLTKVEEKLAAVVKGTTGSTRRSATTRATRSTRSPTPRRAATRALADHALRGHVWAPGQ